MQAYPSPTDRSGVEMQQAGAGDVSERINDNAPPNSTVGQTEQTGVPVKSSASGQSPQDKVYS